MICKTALLTGIAGVMLMAGPALAQEAASGQMPPAETQTQPPAGPPAQPGTLQLQPGSDVKGSDGATLGKLEGVRQNEAGDQELTVRGGDGQLRGVPLGGLRQDGVGVVVDWTAADYRAATSITGDAPDPTPAAPSPTESPTAEPTASDDAPVDPAAPPPVEPQA